MATKSDITIKEKGNSLDEGLPKDERRSKKVLKKERITGRTFADSKRKAEKVTR